MSPSERALRSLPPDTVDPKPVDPKAEAHRQQDAAREERAEQQRQAELSQASERREAQRQREAEWRQDAARQREERAERERLADGGEGVEPSEGELAAMKRPNWYSNPTPSGGGGYRRDPPSVLEREQRELSERGRRRLWIVVALAAMVLVSVVVVADEGRRSDVGGWFAGLGGLWGEDTAGSAASAPTPVAAAATDDAASNPPPPTAVAALVASPSPAPSPTAIAIVVAPAPAPNPTATPEPTSTPVPTLTAASSIARSGEINQLRAYVTEIINIVRLKAGLPPLTLAANPSAQRQADDMLRYDHAGHYRADGRKPSVAYTQAGGTSYVRSAVAATGYTTAQWQAAGCEAAPDACPVPAAWEAVASLHGAMVEGAAGRPAQLDALLDPRHRAVNVGLAWNGRRVTLALHFEGGAAIAPAPPVLALGWQLTLAVLKQDDGLAISPVAEVYHDPPPSPLLAAANEALGRPCVGAGAGGSCARPIAVVLDPGASDDIPAPGAIPAIAASAWLDAPGRLTLTADMRDLMRAPGVYTIVVRAAPAPGETVGEAVVELSFVVEA